MTWDHHRIQGLGRALLRLSDVALGVMYATVALLGAVHMTPRAILVTVPVFAAGGLVMARRTTQAVFPDVRLPATCGLPLAAVAGLLPPFATGMDLLGDSGLYVLLPMVGLLIVRATVWAHGLDSRLGHAAVQDGPAPVPSTGSSARCPPHELLRTLSDEDLFTEWRDSVGRLSVPTVERHEIVRWRAAILDEMRRRHPAAFDAWLIGGAESEFEQLIRADSDGARSSSDDSTE